MHSLQPSMDCRYLVELAPVEGLRVGPWQLGPGRFRIGRDPHCALSIECASLSRQHVELEVMESGGVVISDLGSTNGTRLNGEPILRRALCGDFELCLGRLRLSFRERAGPQIQTTERLADLVPESAQKA